MGERHQQGPFEEFLARLRSAAGDRQEGQEAPDSDAPYESERESFEYKRHLDGPGVVFEKITSLIPGPENMPLMQEQIIKRPLSCGCDLPPAGACMMPGCDSLACGRHLRGCLDRRCHLTGLCPVHYRNLRHHPELTYCLRHIRRHEWKHFLRHITFRE